MRVTTRKVVEALARRSGRKIGNTQTDGRSLWLWGNKIAQRDGDSLSITFAGWHTLTTRERLRGVLTILAPHATLVCRGGRDFLNGHYWDGSWADVDNYFGVEVERPTSINEEFQSG